MKGWERLKNEESAQAIVEFTLILPILLFLILGMVEFGWLLNAKITLNGAVREGARAGIVLETIDTNGEKTIYDTVEAALQPSGLVLVKKDYIVEEVGDNLIVTVGADIEPIVGLFVSDTVHMTSKAQMRRE